MGISTTASKDEIKKAYRQLALKWHPDKNKSPNAHERFIEINQAYLILSDDEGRSKYDTEYSYYFGTNGEARTDFENQGEEFKDEDLREWSANAKQQAKKYSRMSFDEFSKMIGYVFKEVGLQSASAVIYAISGVLGASGVFSLITGIRHGDPMQIILALIIVATSVTGFTFITKRYQK